VALYIFEKRKIKSIFLVYLLFDYQKVRKRRKGLYIKARRYRALRVLASHTCCAVVDGVVAGSSCSSSGDCASAEVGSYEVARLLCRSIWAAVWVTKAK
jgi:hypothetical protein